MKTSKAKIDSPVFRIVADGGLSSTNIGEGRFIPSLVIDTNGNSEVTDLIKLHNKIPSGDTKLSWTKPDTFFKSKTLTLYLEFINPMNISFGIEFTISDKFSLIDGIIQSRGFYLQSGKSGDKISEFKNDCILIEVPNVGFDDYWNKLLFDTLKEDYKKKGASRKEIPNFVKEHIKRMREIWNMRRTI
jgi:hypothetical protein